MKKPGLPKQLIHLVFGGELDDVKKVDFKDLHLSIDRFFGREDQLADFKQLDSVPIVVQGENRDLVFAAKRLKLRIEFSQIDPKVPTIQIQVA